MDTLIQTALNAVSYYFMNEGHGGNIYRLHITNEGQVGLIINNFNIIFPLFEIHGNIVLLGDMGIDQSIKELISRVYSIDRDSMDNLDLINIIQGLENSVWKKLAESLVRLPIHLVSELSKLYISETN